MSGAEPRVAGRVNALVLSGGGFQGLTIIKGLRHSGAVRVLVADLYDDNVGRYFADGYFVLPRIDEDDYLSGLEALCRQESIQIILPSTDRELPLLARSKARLAAQGVWAAVSEPAFLQQVTNKRSLVAFLKEAGLPTLPTFSLAQYGWEAPILGKPIFGWGSRGQIVLHNSADVPPDQALLWEENYLWQPWLAQFDEYSIDFALREDGQQSGFVVRERLRTSGGFAVITQDVADPWLQDIVPGLIQSIYQAGGRGMFNVQVLRSKGRYYFTDLNARIGTSAVHGYVHGVNYPLFLCGAIDPAIQVAGSEPFEAGRHPVRMVRYLEELWITAPSLDGVRAVVFDLDDTLINHKQWIFEKLEAVAAQHAARLPAAPTFLAAAMRQVEEGNRANLFDTLAAEFGLSREVWQDLIDTFRAATPQRDCVYADVIPTLERLRRSGLRLGLLTDNPPASQQRKLVVGGLLEMFDAVVFARNYGSEKPNRLAFETAAQQLQVECSQAVMVGDNLYRDVLGALTAGYRHAFWLARQQASYSFDPAIAAQITGERGNYTRLAGLRELAWYFVDSPDA
jgi:HAD superfamily hydrolase (TIGR01549 family)